MKVRSEVARREQFRTGGGKHGCRKQKARGRASGKAQVRRELEG